jgi:hypothetical protein
LAIHYRGNNAEEKDLSVQLDEMDDLIRGAIFCSTDKVHADKRGMLLQFVEMHNLSKEVHQLRLQLEEKGHPHYIGLVSFYLK